jgi:hypothetical protein
VGGAAVAVGAGKELHPGLTAAFAIAGAVGIVALVVTSRLPVGTSSSPPSVTEQVPASAPE